ncbi:hypothetical protein LZ32DRAFT_149260 [Colletotrichum eremochloae]|nr:hypothetical protein LZ32DRAFT_149260 [Colletotrichum eremochloae]
MSGSFPGVAQTLGYKVSQSRSRRGRQSSSIAMTRCGCVPDRSHAYLISKRSSLHVAARLRHAAFNFEIETNPVSMSADLTHVITITQIDRTVRLDRRLEALLRGWISAAPKCFARGRLQTAGTLSLGHVFERRNCYEKAAGMLPYEQGTEPSKWRHALSFRQAPATMGRRRQHMSANLWFLGLNRVARPRRLALTYESNQVHLG